MIGDGMSGDGQEGTMADPQGRARRWRRGAIVLGVVLVAASLLVPFLEPGVEHEVVFGPGAAAAVDQGTVFATVPHRRIGDVIWLELEPGDTLVVRNLDDEVHQVAGVAARPGETVLHTFRERGVFSDECSLDITVFVEVGRR
jgi:hypothetical protein